MNGLEFSVNEPLITSAEFIYFLNASFLVVVCREAQIMGEYLEVLHTYGYAYG